MKEILNKIIGVDDLKENKLYFALKIVISLIFAITILLDSMIVFNGYIYGTLTDIHFTNIGIKNALIFVVTWISTFIILGLIQILVDKIEKNFYKKECKPKKKRMYFIFFLIILVCWLPYILSYFPGGIFSDTADSIYQATGERPYKNNNPLLYAFIIKAFIMVADCFGGGKQLGLELFTVFQFLIMVAVVSYSIYWLYKRNISTKYIVLTTMFFGLFRVIPMYAISIWKDTPFCIALYVLTIFIAETIYKDGKNLERISGIIKYFIIMIFVAFLRNNGIYIAIALTAILFIVYRKNIFNTLKVFSIVSVLQIIAIFIIQGPIYNNLKLNGPLVESLGVPIQQLCYVVANDGNLTQYQKDFITTIYPEDRIKQVYTPCIVDPVKLDGAFNRQYLEDNKIEFLKVWAKVCLQNPVDYIKAYLLNTMGFWDVNKATLDGYINPRMWKDKDKVIGIVQSDYIKNTTGISVRDYIRPTVPISSAIYLFIMLFSSIFVIYKKRYKNLIILLPAFLTWGTIMIAVPLAFSLRYVFILLMVMPITILAPFLKQERNEQQK